MTTAAVVLSLLRLSVQITRPPLAARKFWKLLLYFLGLGSYRGRVNGRYKSNDWWDTTWVEREVGGVKSLGCCAHACVRRQDQLRQLSSSDQKVAGRSNLTDNNEAGVQSLQLGEEGSSAVPVFSPPVVDYNYYPLKAIEDNRSSDVDPSPPTSSPPSLLWRF